MPKQSVAALLASHAAAQPHRPAITHEGVTLDRAALEARTNRLARAFEELGVTEGSLVTIALPNSIGFYESTLAALKLGAIPQPVPYRLPAHELQEVVNLAQPSLLVGGAPDVTVPGARIPRDFVPSPDLGAGPLPERVSPSWKAPMSGGSTGRPKLILSGEPALFDPEESFLGQVPDQNHLVPGPLYHNGPFTFSMRGLFLGHHVVLMSRFDARRVLELIEAYRINWLMLVPTMMQRIWRLDEAEREGFDLSSVDMIWHVAAPCPLWLKDAWIDWLGPERLWEVYAGTEAQGATVISGTEWLARPGSVGQPVPGCQIKIFGPDGEILPPGEIGEIYMMPEAGPGTTYRYLGATPRRNTDGFDSIGDMGYLDEDGYLFLADRRTDLVISGGANIYPAEVEAAIDAHPAVRSSVVIGLPDDDLGQAVHAIVDTLEPLSENELLEFLAARLVRYKVPRTLEFVTTPLRDDAGKVRRSALRDERLRAMGIDPDASKKAPEPPKSEPTEQDT